MRWMRPVTFLCVLLISLHQACNAESAGPCSLDFMVVRAISGSPLLTWKDAMNAGLGNGISLAMAQDTYAPASFAVKTKNGECRGVTVSASDLRNEDGTQTIKAEKIRINYVKKWFQAGTAWTGIAPAGERKLVPELLVNDPELVKIDLGARRNYLKINRDGKTIYIDISAEDHLTGGSLIPPVDTFDVRDTDTLQPITVTEDVQQIWLSVSTDINTRAGTYFGFATLQQGTQLLLNIPIRVRVLPFSLPEPKLEYSIYYRGQLAKNDVGTISSEYKSIVQYKAELTDIKRHGVSNPTVYQEYGNYFLLRNALTIRHDLGFSNNRLYYLGLSAGAKIDSSTGVTLSKAIAQVSEILKPMGYTDLYVYGIDEAKGEKQRRQLSSWETVHSAGAKVFAAGSVGTYDNVGDSLDLLILSFAPNPTEVKKFHNVGKRVLTYAYPQSGPENPEIFRRNYGIKLWAAGVDGAMPYAYMHSFGSSWNDFDHIEYRDHHFVYPTANGVIDTIAWEGFHEAIEDVRYLTALEMLSKELIKVGCTDPNCKTTLAGAQAYLDQLQTGKNQDDLDLVRSTVIEYLTTLGVAEHSPPSAPPSPSAAGR